MKAKEFVKKLGVEVMHSLHCLNAIRKSLSPEYYALHDDMALPPDMWSVRIGELATGLEVKGLCLTWQPSDHCIEQLRQNLQCATNLTPVQLRAYGHPGHINMVGTPQVRTCRDWDAFRAWYTEIGQQWGSVHGGGT